MTRVYAPLGASIRRARLRAGKTVEQLADEVHRCDATVEGWEEGRSAPPIATLYRVAAALGTTASALLDDREPVS
jgi:transcriptional regulator with XRE-family HTH domain